MALQEGRVIRGLSGDFITFDASNTFILKLYQLGLETDTGKWKVGDGTTHWTALSYLPSPPSIGSTTYGASLLADPGAVVNTATATQLWAPANIPASYLYPGASFRMTAWGTLGAIATSGLFQMPIKLDGTTVLSPQIAQSQNGATGSATSGRWRLVADIIIDSIGASGKASISSQTAGMSANGSNGTGGNSSSSEVLIANAQTVDTTDGLSVVLLAKMATANAGNQINLSRANLVQIS